MGENERPEQPQPEPTQEDPGPPPVDVDDPSIIIKKGLTDFGDGEAGTWRTESEND